MYLRPFGAVSSMDRLDMLRYIMLNFLADVGYLEKLIMFGVERFFWKTCNKGEERRMESSSRGRDSPVIQKTLPRRSPMRDNTLQIRVI